VLVASAMTVADLRDLRDALGGVRPDVALADFHPDAALDLSSAPRLVPFLRRSPDPMLQVVPHRVLDAVKRAPPPAALATQAAMLAGIAPAPAGSVSEQVARANLMTAQRDAAAMTAVLDDIARDRDDAYAARAFDWLQRDRVAAGAPAFVPDPALAAIAQAHSRAMRDAGVAQHSSGLAGRYRASGENVARNTRLDGAQAALMTSPGHRANIVDARFTHAAVGAVRGHGAWFVTQLFARPVAPLPLDPGAAIADRIAAARAALGLPALALRADLTAIARRHAPVIAAGGVDGVTDRVSAEVLPLAPRTAVATYQVGELDDLALPDAALDGTMTGLGAAAAFDVGTGHVGAVVIVADSASR
jgi:uncharacterized protein YkwD